METQIQFDENAVCDSCGRYGAFLLDDRRLCGECYEAVGSCCPEFGGHDQWELEEEGAKEKAE